MARWTRNGSKPCGRGNWSVTRGDGN
ncbi:unnamed protein product [Timema podura]|uniref:Uncharacterized protein n=2 Tax=Timema TaxID=61471 RepID=A0A7R9K7N9_TIMGE|nr:unnamed protein product [Timema genevievae]CAG2067242.1 unnamed protein product [Timema podura]